MSRKNIHSMLAILLILTVVFITTGCEKLKAKRLQANYYFSRANSYFTDQKFRLAIEEYEKALGYDPDLVEAYRFLGESYKSLYKPGVDNGGIMSWLITLLRP